MLADIKRRAREYVDEGDYRAAIACMIVDLPKINIVLPAELQSWAMFAASKRDEGAVIHFIEGVEDEPDLRDLTRASNILGREVSCA